MSLLSDLERLHLETKIKKHYQALRRQKNVNKHLRIARATTNTHERALHYMKAERLLNRYEALIEKQTNVKSETK